MKKRGFTLVEIMIVVAIIGLLAAIAIPSFTKIRAESRKSACQNSQRMLRDAIEQYAMAQGLAETYTMTAVDETNVLGYLKGGLMPICPEGNTPFVVVGSDIQDKVACPSSTAGHDLP